MNSSDISTWQIVKWVLIVLVAAFIGQFGKTFAQYLMHRFRREKPEAQMPVQPSVAESSAQADGALRTNSGASEALLKTQKKEAKVLLKAKKKDQKNK